MRKPNKKTTKETIRKRKDFTEMNQKRKKLVLTKGNMEKSKEIKETLRKKPTPTTVRK